jgi:uncharacterized protein (DUF2249 family)
MTKLSPLLFFLSVLSTGCRKSLEEDYEVNEKEPALLYEDASIHPSRCSYEDCVCKVEIPPYTPVYKDKNIITSTSVYFEEDKFLTPQGQAEKIKYFLEHNKDTSEIFILGYTDGCGSYQYNRVLSKKRAREALRQTRLFGYRGKVIQAGMSEITSTHEPKARRADIISSKNLVFKVPPPNLVADVYLLDASGSISDYSSWVNVISANKKRNSRLYISYTQRCKDGTNALDIRPNGPTEVWWSYWQTLDKMKPGQTLIILSDFNSRIPLTSREHTRLTQKAQQRGVKVYAVQL